MKDENINSENTSDFKNENIEKICNVISQNIRKRLIEGALVNIFWFCLITFGSVFVFNNFIYSGEPTRFPPFNFLYSWLGDRFPQNENMLTQKTL